MTERRLNMGLLQRLRLLLKVMVVWGLLFGAGWPARVLAQDFAAAGQHFSAAQELFAQGKFAAAAAEYQAAYNLTRDVALLPNIGESWQRASMGKKALEAYRAYLAASAQAPDRVEIEARIASIEVALAPGVTAQAPASGSSTPAPNSIAKPSDPIVKPSDPIVKPSDPVDKSSNPGDKVSNPGDKSSNPGDKVSNPGDKSSNPGDKVSNPGDKSSNSVDKALNSVDKAVIVGDKVSGETDKPLITPSEEKPRRLKTAAWVSIAAAVALATGGAIVGLGAQNRADELRRRTTQTLSTGQPPLYDDNQREAYTTLWSEGRAYNAASIALLSVASAAAVGGAVMLVVDQIRKPKLQALAAGRWSLAPVLLPTSAGFAATGNF
jgi:hypothetical protein